MAYQVTKTDAEIDDLFEKCIVADCDGTSKYPGETYEQGIKAALDWVLNRGMDGYHPLDDCDT